LLEIRLVIERLADITTVPLAETHVLLALEG
jgi:hypothetical protein